MRELLLFHRSPGNRVRDGLFPQKTKRCLEHPLGLPPNRVSNRTKCHVVRMHVAPKHGPLLLEFEVARAGVRCHRHVRKVRRRASPEPHEQRVEVRDRPFAGEVVHGGVEFRHDKQGDGEALQAVQTKPGFVHR